MLPLWSAATGADQEMRNPEEVTADISTPRGADAGAVHEEKRQKMSVGMHMTTGHLSTQWTGHCIRRSPLYTVEWSLYKQVTSLYIYSYNSFL